MTSAEIELRAIRPDDSDALAAFHDRLSPESQYLRYFSTHPHLSAQERHRFTELDQHDRAGVVATLGDRIVGWAEYDRIGTTNRAELAVVVEDAFQQHGIGTRLIAWLLERAGRCGLERLVAETLPANHKVRTLLHDSGAQCTTTFHDGVLRVALAVPSLGTANREAEGPEESGLVPVVPAF